MKKINFKKYLSLKNTIFVSLLLVTIFLFGSYALAADWVNNIIGGIIGVFISGITKILILLVNALIEVASYSDFIHAEAVTKGWVVVRDVCNMFFVVILLVIAFATILGKEEYSAKKNLPKLIMAAVLINFSKMFCGLMIDVANVVMLTFVNAFKEIGAGNIIDMLGISDILKYGQGGNPPTLAATVAAYIFGLIYVLIATVVVASMLAMLIMRIVMMWIYIVLSPAAFFLQAVPGKGQQYASKWWSEWSSNLIVGPVLAFFLWLSFAALQTGNSPIPMSGTDNTQQESSAYAAVETSSKNEPIDSKAGSKAGFIKFVIAIGMLLGGMKIAKEVGGETGSALGAGMGYINKGKAMAIGGVKSAARGTAKLTGRAALGSVSFADRLQSAARGKGFENKSWVGKATKAWGDDLQASAKKNRKAAISKYLGKVGMGEKMAVAGQEITGSEGFQRTVNAAKGVGIGFGAAALGGFTLPAGIGVMGIGGAMGYMGRKMKGDATKYVSSYEGADKEYNKNEALLNEHNNNQSFVDEFDQNKTKFNALNRPQVGFGAKMHTTAEAIEFAEASKFINDQGNISKYGSSVNYLKNSSLSDKQKAFQDSKAVLDTMDKGKYDASKKIVAGTGILGTALQNFDAFSNTRAVWKDMTAEQKKAETWVKVAANNSKNDTLSTAGTGKIYGSEGLTKQWKQRFDLLNKGGGDNDQAIASLVAEIKSTSNKEALVEFAKAISAYEGGGASLSTGFGQLKSELSSVGEDPSKYSTSTLRQYKNFDENLMEHKPGTGQLAYEAFAKNATKHEAGKDIMDVSFAKLNAKLPANFKLKEEAGINEASGEQLKAVSGAMANLIDDEIKALQSVPDAAINADKIAQLNTAKSRLMSGDVSNLSLENSDMVYKGNNDSERRRNKYNARQHEIMHSAGATNEAAVYEGSDALQRAKLAGKIPGAGGERYDVAMGKMIAEMEKAQASQEEMSQAITGQIGKWQVPNAQRVLETEKGVRDSSPVQAAEIKVEGIEKAINKLNSSLQESSAKGIQLTPIDKDFFRRLSAKEIKVTSNVVEKLKPLGVMAANEEKKRNP